MHALTLRGGFNLHESGIVSPGLCHSQITESLTGIPGGWGVSWVRVGSAGAVGVTLLVTCFA